MTWKKVSIYPTSMVSKLLQMSINNYISFNSSKLKTFYTLIYDTKYCPIKPINSKVTLSYNNDNDILYNHNSYFVTNLCIKKFLHQIDKAVRLKE